MTGADARAALERGRPVVLIRPPAVHHAQDLWDVLGPLTPGAGAGAGPSVLIICGDDAAASEWVATAPAGARGHAVTGLARAARVLKEHQVVLLAGAPQDLTALLQRAALKLDAVKTVVLAWPEALVAGEAGAVDTLLGEARDARRVILSWNPAVLGDFFERHAHRALVVGAPPVNENGQPLPPVCRARYAIVPPLRRGVAAHDALDMLSAVSPLIWGGGLIPERSARHDAVLCTTLPSRDELAALARLDAGEPILFISGAQLPYLRSIATVTPLALPSGADRARDRAAVLRERLAQRLTTGEVDAELTLLDPLFERFDPAEVAGAVLSLLGEEGRGTREEAPPPPPTGTERVKLFVNIGKKDRVTAKDFVGALIREAGVAKGDVGRIEVRETFSLVEVAAGAADRAIRGLTGTTIRGRRVTARSDRDR